MPRNDLEKLDQIVKPKRYVVRPHWKEICEEQSQLIQKLETENKHLRLNGSDHSEIAKVKAEAFSAGVAAALQYFQ